MKAGRRVKKKTDKIREQVNVRSHGFAELIDGIKEIKPKSNHVYSKSGFDHVQLNGGFTTSFWIYIDRMSFEQDASILYQWRNVSEYDFRVGFKHSSIYLEVRNQADEVEKIMAEKKLTSKRWYSVTVKFEFESQDMCDASIFINANFDGSASVSNYNPFNYVSVSVGRFKKIKSFTGAVAELFVFFYPMTQAQIEEHYSDGLEELERGDGQFLQKVLEKDEAAFNRQNFATEKKIPDSVLREVEASPTFFKTIKEEPSNADINDRVEGQDEETQVSRNGENNIEAMQNLDLFIFENPLLADQITELANNYEWILTVSSVMATDGINKDGALELTRFMKILKFCKIKLQKSVVWEMANLTKTNTEILDEYDESNKFKGVLYYYFLKIVKEIVFSDMISHLQDEDVENVSVGHYSDSDDHVEEEEPEDEGEEEKVESEKAVGVNMRKDSFHSSPDKFRKLKNYDGEGEGDENADKEGESEKPLDPVLPEDHKKLLPSKTIIDEASVNDDGLIKNEQDKDFVVPEPEPEPEEEHEEVVIEEVDDSSLPDLDPDWNTGEFSVNIIRCSGCHNHYDYCRHSEDEYINAFNEFGNVITEKFPEAVVIGNHERPTYLGCFDVYVRGVGPMNKRDEQGRYFIFRKKEAGRMPKAREITDLLTILCLLYGNSERLGQAQNDFKRHYGYLVPKPCPEMHENPAEIPSTVKKQPDLKKNVKPSSDRIMTCKNWGCGRDYNEEKNEKYSCQHHPGVYQFGSRHGLWPESWTCCRKEWDSMGCRKGFHRGVQKEFFTRLCINHGEPNPSSIYPDSFCGKPYQDGEKKPDWQMTDEDKEALLQCKIHPGYLKFDKRSGMSEWTCCNEDAQAGPCSQGEHKSAEFPDEEAKKYFYDRPLKPIGGYAKQNQYANEFEIFGRFCGIFREAKVYTEKNPPVMEHVSRDQQKKLDQLDQVCLHWACGKEYKEANNHKKACRCHTGRWDFGNSVRSCSETSTADLMWEPHWTCCRGQWDDPGCKKLRHKGVYAETYDEIKREYQWPDPNAQIYFKKKISHLWRNKMMNQCDYDEETLLSKLEKKERDSRGRLSVGDLQGVCDYLRLNLLANSDDMSYHFKFQDVVNGTAQTYMDDGDGNIDKEKFMKWWYMTTDEVLHKDDPPPEEPEEEQPAQE